MKKHNANKSTHTKHPVNSDINEKPWDVEPLDIDLPEEDRAPMGEQLKTEDVNTENWSQAEDRGEDLANNRDPLIQQPEETTQTPPELNQKRTRNTFKDDENLADRFDKERKTLPF